MGWTRAAYIVFAAFFWLWESSSFAYPTPVDFNGKISRWNIGLNNPEVTYEIIFEDQFEDELMRPFVEESIQKWNGISTSFIKLTAVSEGAKAQITIKAQQNFDGGRFTAGYSIFDEEDGSGPTHCSVNISTKVGGALTAFAKTALHEIGHCLGLGHSLIPEAIMSYSLERNSFNLDTDDMAAVSRLYPADGSPPSLPPGCAVGSFSSKTSPLLLCLWLMLPLLLAIRNARST